MIIDAFQILPILFLQILKMIYNEITKYQTTDWSYQNKNCKKSWKCYINAFVFMIFGVSDGVDSDKQSDLKSKCDTNDSEGIGA